MGEPLYRRTFDAATLVRVHPPRFGHPHKAALFAVAFPDDESVAPAAPPLEVTRWPQHVPATFALPREFSAEVRPDFYDYAPPADTLTEKAAVAWHVNFADPRLFVAYGSGLLAQDEMQVVEHPALACVREALLAEKLPALTSDETGATPVLVRNVERRLALDTGPSADRPAGLYGNRFAVAPRDAVARATRRLEPPTLTNLIAIAAPAGGRGDYTEAEIAFIFATAYTGCAAAVNESMRSASAHDAAAPPVIVHTGFWGCGAFGGDRRLMTVLQSLAARAAGVSKLIFHAGDLRGADTADIALSTADRLAGRLGLTTTLDDLAREADSLACRWGVGDGT